MQGVRSIHELGQLEWKALKAGSAFQSQRWHALGAKVRGECLPIYLIYLIIRQGERAFAHAALWLIRSEPFRLPGGLQDGLFFIFRHLPLLIDRWLLADTSGACEFKQRRGCRREDDNHRGVMEAGPLFPRLRPLAAAGS